MCSVGGGEFCMLTIGGKVCDMHFMKIRAFWMDGERPCMFRVCCTVRHLSGENSLKRVLQLRSVLSFVFMDPMPPLSP